MSEYSERRKKYNEMIEFQEFLLKRVNELLKYHPQMYSSNSKLVGTEYYDPDTDTWSRDIPKSQEMRMYNEIQHRRCCYFQSLEVTNIDFLEDEIVVTATHFSFQECYEDHEEITIPLLTVLMDDNYNKLIMKWAKELRDKEEMAPIKLRQSEELDAKVAKCCKSNSCMTLYLDPVTDTSHTRGCIKNEIIYLEENCDPSQEWGKRWNVNMTIKERVFMLRKIIGEPLAFAKELS